MFHFVVTSLIYYLIIDTVTMRKRIFAIIGALIAGGLGIAMVSAVPAAHAAMTQN
jgi:hypothetical protein